VLREATNDVRVLAEAMMSLEDHVAGAAQLMVSSLKGGGKILACGNGGSAAEAQHFVTELVGRYKSNRRSLPSIWLGGDTGQMTCIANDFSADEVFSRPLAALGTSGDVLLVLSTSGVSTNVVKCIEKARELGIASIALLGKGGGPAGALATWPIIVPSQSTARIQEMHLMMVHLFCDAIEAAFVD
jgi:D-sedoheptulose 7-phosphate isomerase